MNNILDDILDNDLEAMNAFDYLISIGVTPSIYAEILDKVSTRIIDKYNKLEKGE